jgi:short-subunit dehydrogenase
MLGWLFLLGVAAYILLRKL